MANNIFLFIRIFLGLLFILSGGEKAVSPAENFLYIIQSYAILPDPIAKIAALMFPWIELFIGATILLGLWLETGLKVLLAVSSALILMVGQAIVRRLPIDSCGCFGNLVHLPLQGVIVLDLTVFALTVFCLKNMDLAKRVSCDNYFSKTA